MFYHKTHVLITSALTTIQQLVNYLFCYRNRIQWNKPLLMRKIYVEVLDKLNSLIPLTVVTIHILHKKSFHIKLKLMVIRWICCSEYKSDIGDKYYNWTCQDMIYAVNVLLDKIFVRSGNKVFRQIVGISMGTSCAPL
jgi:hypothetical protein